MKICNNSAESIFTITLLNGSNVLERTLQPKERITVEEHFPNMPRYVQLSVKCGDQIILPKRTIEKDTYVGLLGRGSPHVHISFDENNSADAKTPTTEMLVLVAKKVHDFFDLSRGQLIDKEWSSHDNEMRLGLFYKTELAPLVKDCTMRYDQLQTIWNAIETTDISRLITKDKLSMNRTTGAALNALYDTDFTKTPSASNIACALSTAIHKAQLPSVDKARTPAASTNSTSDPEDIYN